MASVGSGSAYARRWKKRVGRNAYIEALFIFYLFGRVRGSSSGTVVFLVGDVDMDMAPKRRRACAGLSSFRG